MANFVEPMKMSSKDAGDTTPVKGPSSNVLSNVGTGLQAFGDIFTGINALSTANTNAKLYRQQGDDSFNKVMQGLKESVGAYEASQGASGVISNSAKDVKQGAISRGISDATNARYNLRMQAVNETYQGKMAYSKGLVGAGTSILNSFGKS
jgi:hypothetical protein